MKSSRPQKTPTVLSIAGSDSSGGAGIQADLRTFNALGVHGATAITALTCQNSTRILGVQIAREVVVGMQIEAVCEESLPRAVKTGMLANPANVTIVARELERWRLKNIVVDPVIVSSSGRRLLSQRGVETMYEELLPQAALVTPNIHEAAVLLGENPVSNLAEMRIAAGALSSLLEVPVLLKGGHLPESEAAVDVLCVKGELHEFRSARAPKKKIHGSGCTYSAAIAAWLARGENLVESVRKAKQYMAGLFRELK